MLSTCQLHVSLTRTAQIYLELHFCVELHTKKALPPYDPGAQNSCWKIYLSNDFLIIWFTYKNVFTVATKINSCND